MPKLFWLVVFAIAVGTGMTATKADQPPFEEGPQACRMNQMSELAPCGPWEGGPDHGP